MTLEAYEKASGFVLQYNNIKNDLENLKSKDFKGFGHCELTFPDEYKAFRPSNEVSEAMRLAAIEVLTKIKEDTEKLIEDL